MSSLQDVAGQAARLADGALHHDAGRAVGLVLGLHGLQRQRHQSAHLRRRRHDILRQLGIAFLRHGAAAHRARRYRLLDLAEFLLHERVNFPPDFAAGGGKQAEQAHVLCLMIAQGARRHRHGRHAKTLRHQRLRRQAQLAQRREGAGTAAQHGDEDALLAAAQAFHVAAQLIDPYRHLVTKGCWDRVLPMRSSRQQGVLGLLGEVGQQVEQGGQLGEEDRMRPPHQQKLSGLRDVLRRRAPVHVAASVTVA